MGVAYHNTYISGAVVTLSTTRLALAKQARTAVTRVAIDVVG
jgi:hypothetical protein